ncbi:MAG: serine/threonine protein kinase [Thermoguttaceae bacterium]|nr:serine/threonine protein kinase [Thermoguttaceae bacterium]
MSDFFDKKQRSDAPLSNAAPSGSDAPSASETTQISQFLPPTFDSSSVSDAEEPDLEALSERFVEDFRAGRRPSVDDYAERFPEFAEEIRELFPALLLLEKGGAREALSSLSQGASRQGFAISGLERLKNYRIVREIGRGGMGVVYEAWDETLERVVALKVMKIFPGEEAQAIQRFQREAKTAARLHHTNIVPVFDSDVLDDKFFYVMQLVDGVNLEQFLRMKEAEASESLAADADSFADTTDLPPNFTPSEAEHPAESQASVELPLPTETEKNAGFFARRADAKRRRSERRETVNPSAFGARFPAASKPLLSVRIAESNYYQRVCDVVIQAAQGLDYAHRHDVVHRDIKPSNLVVDDDGVVWITDFGLAKSTTENDLTRQGQLVGTLRYLAPEALEGDFSPLSDVYSLGLTLYELLTFTPAFDETNYSKLLAQVAEGRPTRPRKINSKIPLDLETIVLKAIEPTPEKRYASAGELADDLQRFLDDRPIRARRVGFVERVWRWRKRNRLVANLLFSIFVLVAIIFAGISNGYVKARALVRAKEAESQRAQKNLDLALAAFDDVFESLGDAAAVDFNFLNDSESLGVPTDDPSISAKEARVLENLLEFYDGFVAENENEPTLLLKSARARVRVGTIRKLLGRSRDSDAFPKALELYRRALDFAPDETERAQIALEKANVVRAAYEAAPLENRLAEFLPLCAESLAELATFPADSPLIEARDRAAAQLRFERAILRLEKLRVVDERSGRLHFLETPKRTRPTPEAVAEIAADFAAVEERLERLRASGTPQTPDYFFTAIKFNAFSSIWAATLEQPEKALELQAQSDRLAHRFATLYPNDSRSYIATMLHCVVKTVADADALPADDVATRRAELENAENRAFSTADALVEKFPNSPQYDAFRVVVYYHFAKREAVLGNLERADELLAQAETLAVEFAKTRPDFDDFQFFGPLRAARAELCVALGKLDEAEEYVAKMETALRRFEESAPAESDAESPSRRARREETQASVERLRTLLAEARGGAPASSSTLETSATSETLESTPPSEPSETAEPSEPLAPSETIPTFETLAF